MPPFLRWMSALVTANVMGISTVSGQTGTMGSDVAPSGEGVHVDQYA